MITVNDDFFVGDITVDLVGLTYTDRRPRRHAHARHRRQATNLQSRRQDRCDDWIRRQQQPWWHVQLQRLVRRQPLDRGRWRNGLRRLAGQLLRLGSLTAKVTLLSQFGSTNAMGTCVSIVDLAGGDTERSDRGTSPS
ncbi:MAG: hypothetical protein U0575_07160 [Phycisphaerales bacterium]